jgi:hypothetical protein
LAFVSLLSLIGSIVYLFVYLFVNFNAEYSKSENDFRNEMISLSAPMIEEVETLYADVSIDDSTIKRIITPTLESNENIALVRVWNRNDFMQIAAYRLPTGVIASTPEDPVPAISVIGKIDNIFSGKNQKWNLSEIDKLLNVKNQQQLISEKYDILLSNSKIDLELRSDIYNMQNLLSRAMPALVKKYPDLIEAKDLMSQSSDALELDTIDEMTEGQNCSENAISLISSVLEKYRVSKTEIINVIPNELPYQPSAENFGGLLFSKFKYERQFLPLTKPAINENMIEVGAVIEIITVKRVGDYLIFWTWQWFLVPIFLLLSIIFIVLARKRDANVDL